MSAADRVSIGAPAADDSIWPLRDLREAVGRLWPGAAVEAVATIDSTNTELMRRARAGRCDPVLLVAGHQSAGRGRLGRHWHAGSDRADLRPLTFSLGLPLAPSDWAGLSLAVGVAVAEAIDPHRRLPLMLKWPNDLWIEGRKLGGILIETALPGPGGAGGEGGRYLVVGVGINLAAPEVDGLRTPAAGLREWQPDASAPELLTLLAEPLVQAVCRFEAEGFAPFAAGFAQRDLLHGRPLALSDGTGGTGDGVGPRGELRVLTDQGLRLVTSAEVSVRPRAEAA